MKELQNNWISIHEMTKTIDIVKYYFTFIAIIKGNHETSSGVT